MELPAQEQITSFMDQIQPAMEQAAAALGVAATELWSIGIMKQYVDGISMGIGALICAVIILVTLFKILPMHIKWYRGRTKERYDDSEYTFIAYVILILPILFFSSMGYSALLHLLVPEWTLIQEIIGYM